MSSLSYIKNQAIKVNDMNGIRRIMNNLYKYRINKDEVRYYEIVEDVTDILIDKCKNILGKDVNYFPSIEIYNNGSLVDMINLVKYCADLTDTVMIYCTMLDINFTSALLQTKIHIKE